MSRVYYNKLIRDKIPEKIERNGEQCDVRRIEDDDEFAQELVKKVVEEAQGLAQVRGRDELVGELADLHAVVEALKEHYNITADEFARIAQENRERKGGFDKRLFLHWSSDSGYKSNESPQVIKRKSSS